MSGPGPSDRPEHGDNFNDNDPATPNGQNGGFSTGSSSGSSSRMSVAPVPVERQTTLVLQGYFSEEASRQHQQQTTSITTFAGLPPHFSNLSAQSAQAPSNDEILFQLGLEMNRTSMQLRYQYQAEFEAMMDDLGDSFDDIIQGLGEVAMRLFNDPTQITWSKILTFLSFAAWVFVQKGASMLKDALEKVFDKLKEYNIIKWIAEKGGWLQNKEVIKDEITKNEKDHLLPPTPTSSSHPLSSPYAVSGAALFCAAAAAIGGYLYLKRR